VGIQGLDYQVVPVDFTGGLDTRTTSKLVVPGKWDTLTNCTHSKDTGLTKRDGHKSLVADVNGHGLGLRNDELFAINGQDLYSISTATTPASTKHIKGQVGNFGISKTVIAPANGLAVEPDCAYGLGLVAYVWCQEGTNGARTGIHAKIIDAVTGVEVMPETVVVAGAAAKFPRVAFSFDAFVFLWEDAGFIRGRAYVPSLSTTLQASYAIVDTTAYVAFDACDVFGAASFSVCVSYVYADGATSVKCAQVVRAGGVLSVPNNVALVTEVQLAHANIKGICNANLGGSYVATFVNANGATAFAGTTAIALAAPPWGALIGPTRIDTITTATTAPTHIAAVGSLFDTKCAVYTDQMCEWSSATVRLAGSGLYPIRYMHATITAGAWVLNAVYTIANTQLHSLFTCLGALGPFIAGKPIQVRNGSVAGVLNGGIALPVVMLENPNSALFIDPLPTFLSQGSFFLVDGGIGADGVADVATVVGKAMYGLVSSGFTLSGVPTWPRAATPPNTPWVGGGCLVPIQEAGILNTIQGVELPSCGVSSLRCTPNYSDPVKSVQSGGVAVVADGVLSRYDGAEVDEVTFNLFPDGVMVTVAAVGVGGLWPAGVYQAVVVYELYDNAGQRHQSAPGRASQFTIVGATDKPTFEIPNLLLTQSSAAGSVRQVIYCTQAGGVLFHRLTETYLVPEILNTFAAATTTTRVDYPTNPSTELLYHQPSQAGTTLPNLSPGPSDAVAIHQGRVFANVLDRDGAWTFSQAQVPGFGLQWSDALGGVLPAAAGRILGFASLDDKLVIFAEHRLFFVTGSGPSSAGTYSGYSDAVPIPSDVGCQDAASILVMPMGAMFRSSKGWHVLTRDLSVKYIGGPVKRYDGDAVTGVVLMGDRQEVRVSSNHSAYRSIAGGYQLVYSYATDTWARFDIQTNTDPYKDLLQAAASVWWSTIERWVTISLIDGINADVLGVYEDQPGTNVVPFAISLSAKTGFLHLGGLEEFQRVKWLYLTMSAPSGPTSQFQVYVAFDDDYSGASTYGSNIVAMAAMTFPSNKAIDLRHKLRRQKCKSVAFTLLETAVAGAPGITGMQAMAMQIGMKRGTNKLPAAQGVG
jgi:hypothetical protein